MYKYIYVHSVYINIYVYTYITNELDIVMQKIKKNNLSSQGLSHDWNSRLHLKKRKGGERRESRGGKTGGREAVEQNETQQDTSIKIDT